MRILVLTLMMSFLSHGAFGAAEGGAIARVLASLEAVEAEVVAEVVGEGGGAGAANAITTLVKLLKDSEPLVKQNAAGALWNLSFNADNKVTIAKEVSTHDGQELIILNLSSLAKEHSWAQDLLAFINS